MTPIDQTSERSSTSFELRTCSGDMYPGEPMTSPLAVSVPVAPSVLKSDIFEMPKSSTLTRGVPSRRFQQKEVRRLQVAMHDAERVGLGDRLAALKDVADRVAGGHGAEPAQDLTQVGSFEVLHDHVRLARVERSDVQHLGDVIARERDRRRGPSRRKRPTALSSLAASPRMNLIATRWPSCL